MTQVTGTVNQIKSRPTQYGDFYDVIVDGKTYGNGKFAPRGIKEGDVVTFEYDTVQRGQYTNYNIKARSLRKVDGEASSGNAGTNQAAQPAASPAPVKSQYVPFDERQEIISKQAALNTALSFGNLAVASGAVLVPKTAKDSDKLTLVQNWVFTEAARIYNATTGRTWDVQLSETVETPKEVAAATRKAPGRKQPAAQAQAEDTGGDEWNDDFADDDVPF